MSATDEIKKEFELERMILFSDAVFAIAITLLILEVKFPAINRSMSTDQLNVVLKPLYVQLMAFVISFFFIGIMWAKHLQVFKYLRSYDRKIIFLNLLFLFFIVCFPFSASVFSQNANSGMVLPMLIYLGNIAGVSIVKSILTAYLFSGKNENLIPCSENDRKYMRLEGIWTAVMITITFFLVWILSHFFDGDPSIFLWPFYLLGAMSILMRKNLKKYKPKKNKAAKEELMTDI